MRFLPGNAQHIGARSSQQDSFGFADPSDQTFITHGGFLAVVCDGMGGMEHGDAASRTAVRTFLDAYRRKSPAETIPQALERSVREANAQVVTLAHSLGLADGVGTTLVAAAIRDRSLYYISVGDSGLFHVSGGHVQTLNYPHVFANLLDQAVARGSMTREEALNHPERESLTSYIGSEVIEEIDQNQEPLELHDGDTILLASDGLFKTLGPEEIRACLQGHPQAWPDTLVEQTLARQREYQDNVTVLSVTIESEARAAIPRTVLMAPPPPKTAGVPAGAPAMLPPTADPPARVPPPPAPAAPATAAQQVAPTLQHEAVSAEAIPAMEIPAGHDAGAPPPAMDWSAAAAPLPAPQRSGRKLWPILLVVLLLAAAAAGWWLLQQAPPTAAPGVPVDGTPREPDAEPPKDPIKFPKLPDRTPTRGPGSEPTHPPADKPAPGPAQQDPSRK